MFSSAPRRWSCSLGRERQHETWHLYLLPLLVAIPAPIGMLNSTSWSSGGNGAQNGRRSSNRAGVLRGVLAFILPLAAHFGTSPPWRGLRFAPSRCCRGCLMYTKATSLPNLYIRNIIPDDMGIPSPAVLGQSGRGDAPFHAGAQPMRTMIRRSSRKLDSCY
jgi:hypothetical protein